MKRDILAEVISVEKDIQQCIEAEKTKVRDWIEEVRREAEEELEKEKENIKASFGKVVEEAKSEAEREASLIIQEASAKAGRLAKLNDQILSDIVMKQLKEAVAG